MQLLFFLCSEAAIVDGKSNRLSIFNITEQVQAASFPVLIPKITVTALLSKSKKEREVASMKIHLTLNDKPLVDVPFVIDFQGKQRARGIAEIQGLLVNEPGDIKAELTYKKKVLGEWSFEITQMVGQPFTQLKQPDAAAEGTRDSAPKSRTRKAPKKKSK